MSFEVTGRNLPEYLRGQGFDRAAQVLDGSDPTAGYDRLGRLEVILDLLPEESEATEVVAAMAGALRTGFVEGWSK